MEIICTADKCTGCGLCTVICPKNCISMVVDNKGFMVPVINYNACINCELCKKNCPQLNENDKRKKSYEQKYYLAWHYSEEVRYNSSSGGAFTALAESVFSKGGVVIGAAYTENFRVEHIIVDSIDKLEKLRKSKYVQSEITGILHDVKSYINSGRIVLFTGTPCQCEAVRTLYGVADNLIICDLICHGAQSPGFFRDALLYMEQREKSQCTDIDFRSKSKGWANACTTVMKFKSGKTINKRLNDIPIGSAFLQNLSIRECCNHCQYRRFDRTSDITIGDFWAIRDKKEYLKNYGDLGYSSIIINTPKGASLLSACENTLHIEKSNKEDVKMANNPLWRQFAANPMRIKFWKDYDELPFYEIYKTYLKVNYRALIRWHVIRIGRKTGLMDLYLKIRSSTNEKPSKK